MVVCRADLVGIGMRQLSADPFRVVADLTQGGGNRGAYAVSGQLGRISHLLQRTVECVFADPFFQVTEERAAEGCLRTP
jgi:hypothetical protein